MNVTPEELREAALPLMELLTKFHPHVTCIVDSEHVELVEGIATARREPYERAKETTQEAHL